MARIDDLLYVDDLSKQSEKLSSVPKVSVISHKKVSIPFSVPVSSTPRKIASTPTYSPAPLISPARGERTPFLHNNIINNNNKPNRRGFGVKRVLTNYLGVDTKPKVCCNATDGFGSIPSAHATETSCHGKESSIPQTGTKLR